jgi:hypothetical protein
VGRTSEEGLAAKYAAIDPWPAGEELERARAVARQAGLRRFDERWAA